MARGFIPRYALTGANMSELPGAGAGISRKTFVEIDRFMRDVASLPQRLEEGSDLFVQAMAVATKGGAQRRSRGPVAPRRRSVPALAYRIPVQRITGGYFAGWTHQRLGRRHWIVYNDSREAYFIETGMYMRVRRPILKLSVLGMLRMVSTTKAAERMMDNVLLPLRNNKGQFQSFKVRAQPFIGGTNLAGPSGRLP
jgi:hypothetical protein